MARVLFYIILISTIITLPTTGKCQVLYEVNKSNISFNSDAPKEIISASSNALVGLLDIDKKTFVFKIEMGSFNGFNNPLQREHFKENYMETNLYPTAFFKGKIVDDADLSKDGTYTLRAKGKLNIHGIESERIIKVQVIKSKNEISITSNFSVMLDDHSIKIPRVVFEKLAPEIKVNLLATLTPKKQ